MDKKSNNKNDQKKSVPMRKTYAARGLLDWQMALNVGGAIIRICFSGGSMGSNGVVPAKYTTESPAIQRMIETSKFFEKRIFLHRSEELPVKEPEVENPATSDSFIRDGENINQ